jgi:ureidoacrylate peracid hydrolase
VASTVRDAHLRNVDTILLSDGCAAFNQDVHDATLISLGTVTKVMTCAQAIDLVQRAAS